MKKYVALLRGINVGGNNKISMAVLKELFLSLGFSNVLTYINSGNVLFSANEVSNQLLAKLIENAIFDKFKLHIKVLVFESQKVGNICAKVSDEFVNNDLFKTDVLFLDDSINSQATVKMIDMNTAVDKLTYVDGAIIWYIKREDLATSGMKKFVGSKLYKNMTARNITTVRAINDLFSKV